MTNNTDEPKRCMVSIRCLGNNKFSSLVSIGSCVFLPKLDRIVSKFYIEIDISSQPERYIDPEVLLEWISTNQVSNLVSEETFMIDDALEHFDKYFKKENIEEIWFNPPQLYSELLKNCFDYTDMECPWKEEQERDFRTVVGIYKGVVNHMVLPPSNTKDALEDSIYNARILNNILRGL